MSDTLDDFFEGTGERGAPGFKFGGKGDAVSGTITKMRKTQQTKYRRDGQQGDPLFWADGTPREQVEVTLKTGLSNWDGVTKAPTDEDGRPQPGSEDTGERRIYVKFKLKDAIGDAIRAATGKAGAPKIGAKLEVSMTGTEVKGEFGSKLYAAVYEAPQADLDDIFGGGPAPAKAAPADDAAPF